MSKIKRWLEDQIGTDNEQYSEQYLNDIYWEQYQMEYEMYQDYPTSTEDNVDFLTNTECESE